MKKFIILTTIFAITILSTGCLTKNDESQKYSDYIKSAMDASYLNNNTKYLELADVTEDDTKELYNNTVEYLAYSIMNYNNINYDVINDDIIDEYIDLAIKALNKTKYTINDARKVDGKYQVKLEIEPLNFWENSYDDVDNYIEEFSNKYNDSDSMTDEEIALAEEEYANKVLDILTPYIEDMDYKEKVNKIVEIEIDKDGKYGISDNDWNDIDDYVMGIK
mgnify:CR=1 FL=1